MSTDRHPCMSAKELASVMRRDHEVTKGYYWSAPPALGTCAHPNCSVDRWVLPFCYFHLGLLTLDHVGDIDNAKGPIERHVAMQKANAHIVAGLKVATLEGSLAKIGELVKVDFGEG